MKIPDKSYYEGEGMWPRGSLLKIAREAAALITLETGVWVEVIVKKDPEGSKDANDPIREILFSVMEHQFNTLDEVKKAIANKSFL